LPCTTLKPRSRLYLETGHIKARPGFLELGRTAPPISHIQGLKSIFRSVLIFSAPYRQNSRIFDATFLATLVRAARASRVAHVLAAWSIIMYSPDMDNLPAYIHLPLSQEPPFRSTSRYLDVGDMQLCSTRWNISYTPHAGDNPNPDHRRWSVLCLLSELRSSADLPLSLYITLHMGIRRLSLPKSLFVLKLTALHFYCVTSIHSCSIIFTLITNLGLLELINLDQGMRRKAKEEVIHEILVCCNYTPRSYRASRSCTV
jgi:hypothetical protein